MPERFLLQILRVLVTHGILKSTRGVDGGYYLSKPADQVSLLDVIEAIDGPLDGDIRTSVPGTDAAERNLFNALEQVTKAARKQLESIKFANLIPPSSRPS
jgi:Rrf2 family protein